MGTLLLIGICFGIPIACSLYLHVRYNVKLRYFLIGMITFFVSQILLRLPLLAYFQTQSFFFTFMLDSVPYLLFLSLSAGVFEEGARAAAMCFFKKENGMKKAAMLGLGHGGIEAILLVSLPLLNHGVDLQMSLLPAVERIFAMTAHVCLSVIVWKGVGSRKPVYILLSILAHGIFNFVPIYLGMRFKLSTWEIEGCLMITTMFLVGAVYYGILEREKR